MTSLLLRKESDPPPLNIKKFPENIKAISTYSQIAENLQQIAKYRRYAIIGKLLQSY